MLLAKAKVLLYFFLKSKLCFGGFESDFFGQSGARIPS